MNNDKMKQIERLRFREIFHYLDGSLSLNILKIRESLKTVYSLPPNNYFVIGYPLTHIFNERILLIGYSISTDYWSSKFLRVPARYFDLSTNHCACICCNMYFTYWLICVPKHPHIFSKHSPFYSASIQTVYAWSRTKCGEIYNLATSGWNLLTMKSRVTLIKRFTYSIHFRRKSYFRVPAGNFFKNSDCLITATFFKAFHSAFSRIT